MSYNNPNTIVLLPCDEDEVKHIITNLKKSSSAGYDGIKAQFLQTNCSKITPILTYYINQSFENGIYPEYLKIGKVTPAYKTGNKTDPCNYRPLTCLSQIDKVVEKIIEKRVVQFYDRFDVLSKKNKYIIFSRTTNKSISTTQLRLNSVNIERVEEMTFLGIIIQENLKWNKH
jgi:hypothetical protein